MIDRVVEFIGEDELVAIKNVTINEPFLRGSFSGKPRHAGCAAARSHGPGRRSPAPAADPAEGKVALFMSADKVKFRKAVRPGDQLVINARLTRTRGNQDRHGRSVLQRGRTGGLVVRADVHDRRRGVDGVMAAQIHPTAIIEPTASLGADVVVGAYAYVGGAARIGNGTVIHHHATVEGNTVLGRQCEVFPYAAIGTKTHDLKFRGGEPGLRAGDRNVFREYVTVHSATKDGDFYGARRRQRHSCLQPCGA